MKLFFFLVPCILCINSQAQVTDSAYISSHAIVIADRRYLNDTVYNSLSSSRAILVGEMHGTAGAAEFVEGLARLFLKHNRKVIIGVEISADEMEPFIHSPTADSLAKTIFFARPKDLRPSEAWAKLLLAFKQSEVKYVFTDGRIEQYSGGYLRDSMMYENINDALLQNPEAVFISLSGSYHALVAAHDYQVPMGWYLLHAPDRACLDSTKIVSIGPVFNDGKYWTDQAIFSKATKNDCYLLMHAGFHNYTAVLYIKTMKVSPLWLPPKD